MLSVIGYFPARQHDTERLRTWEVAGTAHADAYLVGDGAGSFGCAAPINTGPTHFVAKAALRHLDAWARGGEPAPAGRPPADRGQGAGPVLLRDQDGIALGGIRTPHVDAPLDTLSGESAPGGPIACILFGSTKPLPAERIAAALRVARCLPGGLHAGRRRDHPRGLRARGRSRRPARRRRSVTRRALANHIQIRATQKRRSDASNLVAAKTKRPSD